MPPEIQASDRVFARRWRSLIGLVLLGAGIAAGVQWLKAHDERVTAARIAAEVRPGDIYMVASVDCPYCAQARAWFSRMHLPYAECTIETEADCATLYRKLQAPGTPVLLVRGQRLVGFRPDAIAAALQRDRQAQ